MADELREARKLLSTAADLDAANRFEEARARYDEARQALQAAPPSADRDAALAMCLLRLAAATCVASPPTDIKALVAEALLAARSGGCMLEAARWLSVLGARLGRVGLPNQARRCLEAADEIFRASHDDAGRQGRAWVALTRGQLALVEGDTVSAHRHATVAGAIFAESGEMGGAQAAAALLMRAEELLERAGGGPGGPDDFEKN